MSRGSRLGFLLPRAAWLDLNDATPQLVLGQPLLPGLDSISTGHVDEFALDKTDNALRIQAEQGECRFTLIDRHLNKAPETTPPASVIH